MRKFFLGTNLKMYKTPHETADYISRLGILMKELTKSAIFFVIPSTVCLPSAIEANGSDEILVGAQNMYWEDTGQFTGEISPLMLKDLKKVSIIEIGHSERRHIFGETSQDCNKKVLSAVKHDFIALLCIGETREEKDYGVSDETLRTQIKIGLSGLTVKDIQNVWIAYEPVWSIGVNGIPADNEYVQARCMTIKNTMIELCGKVAAKIPVLYGGSVNADNAEGLVKETDIDGLFIGRAAWNADSFYQLSCKVLTEWKKKSRRLSGECV